MSNIYDDLMIKAATTVRNGVRLKNPQKYVDELNAVIERYAKKYNISAGVIKKVIAQESGFWYKTAGRSIKNVPAGDQSKYGLAPQYREYGLMQVYPHYAAVDGFDWRKIVAYNWDENINAGTYHLRDHFNQMAVWLKAHGITKWFDIFTFGIASYNAGVAGVQKAIIAGNFNYTKSFVALPDITQNYMINIHSMKVV